MARGLDIALGVAAVGAVGYVAFRLLAPPQTSALDQLCAALTGQPAETCQSALGVLEDVIAPVLDAGKEAGRQAAAGAGLIVRNPGVLNPFGGGSTGKAGDIQAKYNCLKLGRAWIAGRCVVDHRSPT